jgi:hypothetical protein
MMWKGTGAHKVLCKAFTDEQAVQLGVLQVCTLDAVQEPRTDDAAPLPDACKSCKVHVPTHLVTLGLDDVHALYNFLPGLNLRTPHLQQQESGNLVTGAVPMVQAVCTRQKYHNRALMICHT